MRSAVLVSVMVLVSVATVSGAAIINGSFEDVVIGSPFLSSNPADIPGWTHSGSVGDALLWRIGYADGGGNITVAGSGNQFVTLGGGFNGSGTGVWTTSITGLVSGNSYILSFLMADEGTFSSNQQITVDFTSGSSTGAQVFTANGSSSANYWRNWLSRQETFVASASSATVRFSATTQFDVGLDNVQVADAPVNGVPEPTTVGLMGLGLLGMGIRGIPRLSRSLTRGLFTRIGPSGLPLIAQNELRKGISS